MSRRALVTGGAGFIGSHLADELLARGYEVRVLDDLSPQVHGQPQEGGAGRNGNGRGRGNGRNGGRTRRPSVPDYLANDVEFVRGSVEDPFALEGALEGVDVVVHLASLVGVGQSMYRIADYVRTNNVGTARLLEALSQNPVERLVVASSMSVYGEGRYLAADGTPRDDVERSVARLKERTWEPCDEDGTPLKPVPTPESKPPALASVYALSKFDQERLCLMIGRAYGIPTVALRFFNVYGPRQALSNPYTGVLAIFASRCLNGKRPLVFEDGLQRRDFVSVHDVARACRLALEVDGIDGEVFNIGSGQALTVREVAERVACGLGRAGIEPEITGEYRVGDIRHCFADIGRARDRLGFAPQVSFEDGLDELAGWLETQVSVDLVDNARRELSARGLTL